MLRLHGRMPRNARDTFRLHVVHISQLNNVRIVSNPMKHTLRLIEGNNTARAAHPVDNRIRDFLAGDNDAANYSRPSTVISVGSQSPSGFASQLFSHLIKNACPRSPSSLEPVTGVALSTE